METQEKAAQIENWLKSNGEVQGMVADYLAQNPAVSIPHLLATEDCLHIARDGFEGVLTRDGKWYSLKGSHSLMMNWLAADTLGTTVAAYLKSVPRVCYTSMNEYAMRITHAMTVRPERQEFATTVTTEQSVALEQLADAGLITLNVCQVRQSARIKTQFTKLIHRQMDALFGLSGT
jgi:hypothetical protein